MFYLSRCLLLLVALLVLGADKPLLTVAESSDYKATSRHADVVAFCAELARRAPCVRLGELGVSGEDRKLPLLVLADPPVATPAEAARSGKFVVLTIGNIHAGEVDGKEALLMLARDLALGKERSLLKDLVVVLCPLFNADGNERIARTHRPEQNGPADGVGIRENASGLDLNRDFVKLETPEVRALVRALNEWDPAIFMDLHTTNGSRHRYTLTYDGLRHAATPPALLEYVRDRLLPDAGRRLEKATGFHSFFYGNFSTDRVSWETYPPELRYGIPYVGVRGRAAVLLESYSYASYRDRIKASYAFALACLEHVAANEAALRKALAPTPPADTIVLRTRPAAWGGPWKVLGFVEEEKDGKPVVTTEPKDYTLQFLGKSEARLSVSRPFAYLFPPAYKAAVETILRHGIVAEELTEAAEVDVETYRIDRISRAERAFQRHRTVALEASARAERRRLLAGTVLVRTEQRLGTLAALLLEPGAEDGLATWNFFDAELAEGKDFPVVRLRAAARLAARPLKQPAGR